MADDDGEGGDRAVGEQDDAGAGARGGSALHMNPLRQALPGGGGGGGGGLGLPGVRMSPPPRMPIMRAWR